MGVPSGVEEYERAVFIVQIRGVADQIHRLQREMCVRTKTTADSRETSVL